MWEIKMAEETKQALAIYEDGKLIRVDVFDKVKPEQVLRKKKGTLLASYLGRDFTEIIPEEIPHATLEVHGSNMGSGDSLGKRKQDKDKHKNQ